MAMLSYEFDSRVIDIRETANEEDTEFVIRLLVADPYLKGLKEIQERFEENDVHTDVLFYAYENNEYRVIARRDYYVDFILQLMKHALITKAEWKNEE